MFRQVRTGMGNRLRTSQLSRYSRLNQLSLAIPPWSGAATAS